MLERLKRKDETFDELFERLVLSEAPIGIGAWSEEDAELARAAVKRSRESFERRRSTDTFVFIDLLAGVDDTVMAVEDPIETILSS